MFPLSPALIDDCLPTRLGRRRSGRNCLLCQQPILGDDGFGLSEGVCATCVPRRTITRQSRLREIVQRLAVWVTPPADAVVEHETGADELRAA